MKYSSSAFPICASSFYFYSNLQPCKIIDARLGAPQHGTDTLLIHELLAPAPIAQKAFFGVLRLVRTSALRKQPKTNPAHRCTPCWLDGILRRCKSLI